jgi:hypothetical protein
MSISDKIVSIDNALTDIQNELELGFEKTKIDFYLTVSNSLESFKADVYQASSASAMEHLQSNIDNPDYRAYVENRLSSMLDIRYAPGDTNLIEYVYRNDKQTLRYLQAGDPEERLSIFRIRLVPFPIYANTSADMGQRDVQWQRGRVVLEVNLNFGYAVVKNDNFMPRFFDINRLGLGLAISNTTFTDGDFLAITLAYDVNTYASISFGATVAQRPGFYMGVGINARAFQDLVKGAAAVFARNGGS